MGVNLSFSKRITRIGAQLLIPLLVIDTAWSLIRFIIFNTVYGGTVNERFDLIDNIITNILFTTFMVVLVIGLMMLSIYYIKVDRMGLVASILLICFIGIKTAFIFFRFTQLFGDFDAQYMENTFHIFELTTGLLLILAIISFDVFIRLLKKKIDNGIGGGPFAYLFGFFALIYPIANILSLANVDFVGNVVGFSIMRTLAFIGSILEILVYFDLMRRTHSLKPYPEIKKEKLEESEGK